jgi:anti-anti-sigma regulatory factor
MRNRAAATAVTLPVQIDLYSREQAYDRLCGACASGATVVIADFTGTRYCDTASMRRLLAAHERAAASAAQLRFAIPPGNPARRMTDLLNADRHIPIYDSLAEAEATP